MPDLPPATVSQRLISQVSPKRLTVRLRASRLPDRSAVFSPVFTIDNLTVPIELIQPDTEQTILGYQVRLTPGTAHIVRVARGSTIRVDREKVASFVEGLNEWGINLISGAEMLAGRGRKTRLSVSLALLPGDRLQVETKLTLDDGTSVPKPEDLKEPLADGGWVPFGNEMVKLGLTGTRLDHVLFEKGQDGILEGTLVPQFLKKIAEYPDIFADVRSTQPLQDMVVVPGKATPELLVTGDAIAIRVEPGLGIRLPDGTTLRQSDDEIAALTDGRCYLRYAKGWAEVPAEAVETYRKAGNQLPANVPLQTDLHGTAIPRALASLLAGQNRPWTVTVPRDLLDLHQLADSPPATHFVLERSAADGKLSFTLSPSYLHGQVSIFHDEAGKAIQTGEEWIKHSNAWIKPCQRAYEAVEALAEAEHLPRVTAGFRIPTERRDAVCEAAGRLGSVIESAQEGRNGDVSLALRLEDDDSLTTTIRVRMEDGSDVAPPSDMATVRRNDGWFAVGNDLIRLPPTDPALDVLFANGGRASLGGRHVPKLFLTLNSPGHGIRKLTKDDRLQGMRIHFGKASQRLRVTGDTDQITINSSLALDTPEGVNRELTPADAKALGATDPDYIRVTDGWIEVKKASLTGFLLAREQVRQLCPIDTPIRGVAIPAALLSLHRGVPSGVWQIKAAREVGELHRTVEAPGVPAFRINIEAEDGFPNASLHVAYRHEAGVVPHSLVADAIAAGTKWVRHDGRWYAVDESAYRGVEKCCDQLGLYDLGSCFRVPLHQLNETETALGRLGQVSRRPERIPEAQLNVSLSLVDDRIRLASEMTLEDGRVVQKPPSIGQLAESAGFYVDRDSIVQCRLAEGPLEQMLLAPYGATMLAGDVGPDLLDAIHAPLAGVRRVERTEPLQSLRVTRGKVLTGVTVTGDEDSIQIDSDVRIGTESGEELTLPESLLEVGASQDGRFIRVPSGWLEVEPAALEECRKSWSDLAERVPLGRRLEGTAIPVALEELDGFTAAGWEKRIPEQVKRSHRRGYTSGRVDLEVRQSASGRRPRMVLHPRYLVGGIVLGHEEAKAALRDTEGWLRVQESWIKIDGEAVNRVERVAAQLGLQPDVEGFVIPVVARPLKAASFTGIGELRHVNTAARGAGLTLSLDQTADGRLIGSTGLMLDEGMTVAPQVSFAEMVADEGLICDRGVLIKVELPTALIHPLLARVTGDAGLIGDEVPRFLDAIDRAANQFRDIRLSDELRCVRIRRGNPVCRLSVSGDADHIGVAPELIFPDVNDTENEHPFVESDFDAAPAGIDAYKKVRDGWQVVPASAIERFKSFIAAVSSVLPIRKAIRGGEIPKVLSELDSPSAELRRIRNKGSTWAPEVPQELKTLHRLFTAPATVTFVLQPMVRKGIPACLITPSYLHGDSKVSHAEAQSAIRNGDAWVRSPEGWVRIDAPVVKAVVDRAASLQLEQTDGGYVGKPQQLDHMREVFGRLGHGIAAESGPTPTHLTVNAILDDTDTLDISTRLLTDDGREIQRPEDLDLLRESEGWMAVGDEVFRVPASGFDLDVELLQRTGPLRLSGQEVPRFLKRFSEPVEKAFKIQRNPRLQGLRVIDGVAHPALRVAGDQMSIQVDPMIRVESEDGRIHDLSDDVLMALSAGDDGYVRSPEGWVSVHRSALRRYRKAREAIRTIAPPGNVIEGALIPATLAKVREIEADPRIAGPWNVYYSELVKDKHRLVEVEAAVSFQMDIVESDGRSLLHLDPTYNHARFQFSHQEMADLIRSGDPWARRGQSWVKTDWPSFARVAQEARDLRLERDGNGFVFPAAVREQVLPIFSAIGSVEHSRAYSAFVAKLADFTRIEEVPTPANLRAGVTLRPYQQHGFNWLAFLQRFGLNGILADDMGLGKTIQTLVAIERTREVGRSGSPVLIICPTSVVHNWRAEIDRFLVRSQVVVLQGATRNAAAKQVAAMANKKSSGWEHTYVITSYDIAVRDLHQLSAVPWLYVVVDEGHHIKNPTAQRTQAVKKIHGQHKLVLTGTPIQNGLMELWSLFDYAMPGYLGTQTEFGKTYGSAGSIDWQSVREQLTTRIRPFVLRRLKKDVARDLPEKLTIDHEVELTRLQVQLYKDYLDSDAYKKMLNEIDTNGIGRSHTHIFTILGKLRSICNHPVLVNEDWSMAHVKAEDSAKLAYLEELLDEVVAGEHRALLFCRSTRMHQILERFLNEWGIEFLQLTGDTPTDRRQRLVDQFNSSPDITVFLLSMAGSSGINLTSADTVIFYDHDWNPANDAQAMDRAYRIGQKKDVTVYRLVSKGTIEERILERQRAKQNLADEVIGADAAGFKDLTKEDLMGLFVLDGPNP